MSSVNLTLAQINYEYMHSQIFTAYITINHNRLIPRPLFSVNTRVETQHPACSGVAAPSGCPLVDGLVVQSSEIQWLLLAQKLPYCKSHLSLQSLLRLAKSTSMFFNQSQRLLILCFSLYESNQPVTIWSENILVKIIVQLSQTPLSCLFFSLLEFVSSRKYSNSEIIKQIYRRKVTWYYLWKVRKDWQHSMAGIQTLWSCGQARD